jgi:RNA polymerase sigma-70 factor (ECF subfamily)
LDEQGLVTRAGGGDVAAFNALVERYQDLAYGVAYRTLGDPEAAADATQDAFLSAYNAIRGFRGGSFRAWLLRIVTNACYDHGRRAARRPSASLDAIVELAGGEDALVDPAPLPDNVALRGELVRVIEASLMELPIEQRTVVVMADLHGLSYGEIAEATATSLGTVKSRLSRGRLHLRDRLLRRAPELSPREDRPGT